jgi:transcriptional regulator GlxA family with amidase domain
MWLKHLDMGLSRFYLGVRLKMAQKLLHESTSSIFDIAMQCGFASASHLGRCYHLDRNVPPRASEACDRSAIRRCAVLEEK